MWSDEQLFEHANAAFAAVAVDQLGGKPATPQSSAQPVVEREKVRRILDEELAGVLAHELSHVVQRDHYEVIRKQQIQTYGKDVALGQVNVGGGVIGSRWRLVLPSR